MAQPKPTKRDDEYDTMDVAVALHCRYQKARDLMLAARFGPVRRDGRTIFVNREKVDAFAVERAKRAEKANAPR